MKNSIGFSLVEVLVALVIISTALLGLVGLQASGVRNIITSYNRTQASQLASSMADRIRANVADIRAATAIGGSSKYITLGQNPTAAKEKLNCSNSIGCSVANMAENDVYQWNLALKDTSNGLVKTGKIEVAPYLACPQSSPDPFTLTITVQWSEGRDDNKDQQLDEDLILQTVFQIPRDPC